jgi:hypothetical protein
MGSVGRLLLGVSVDLVSSRMVVFLYDHGNAYSWSRDRSECLERWDSIACDLLIPGSCKSIFNNINWVSNEVQPFPGPASIFSYSTQCPVLKFFLSAIVMVGSDEAEDVEGSAALNIEQWPFTTCISSGVALIRGTVSSPH